MPGNILKIFGQNKKAAHAALDVEKNQLSVHLHYIHVIFKFLYLLFPVVIFDS